MGRQHELETLQQALAQAQAELSAAIDLYRAMAILFWLPQAEAALVQIEGAN